MLNRGVENGEQQNPAYKLQSVYNLLTESQVNQIIKEHLEDETWELMGEEIRPATDGISGFLGDHSKVCLQVKVNDKVKNIRLFIKSMPLINKSKAEFIDEGDFYRREMTMMKLIREMNCADDAKPWCSKAYIFTDQMVVMPDLCYQGYRLHPSTQMLDLKHTKTIAGSLARFHATFANYETRKTINEGHTYTILQDYGDIIKESNFQDTPWMRAAGKLSSNMLKIYSKKFGQSIPDLENRMVKSFIDACSDLKMYEETLNVVIHKDLWMNNFMFKYEDGVPINAVLLDFQCVRYAPPAFDVMILLNLTTSRQFREQHEREVLLHYFLTFSEGLHPATRSRMENLDYDFEEFLRWAELGRKFGLMEAISISPFVLMDSKSAQRTFDDPETFDRVTCVDRTEPVLAYCQGHDFYRQRQIELTEEYVDKYVISQNL